MSKENDNVFNNISEAQSFKVIDYLSKRVNNSEIKYSVLKHILKTN